MRSPRSNRPVANQFEIYTDEGVYFQSYNTVIAFIARNGTVYLNDGSNGSHAWDCSVTTGRYRNQFLGQNTSETRMKIKKGEYKLTNLN